MFSTYSGDIARQRMNDRLREAETYRLTSSTRKARAAERDAAMRRVARSALASLLWPIRH